MTNVPVLPSGKKSPRLHPTVYIAGGSYIIGDVEIGEDSSVWYNAVLRGDINSIVIGQRTNVQDGSVFHVTDQNPVTVGDDVTIGHGAIIHGCRIGSEALIGMGAVLLDGVRVGPHSLVAAGAVVLEKTEIPDASLAAGVPARVIRKLSLNEIEAIRDSAVHYVRYAQQARATPTTRDL